MSAPTYQRGWVVLDPALRKQFLALVRAHPRCTQEQMAAWMSLSLVTIRRIVWSLEKSGTLCSERDRTAARFRRSGPPKVIWLPPRRPARIGKRPLPRAFGFKSAPLGESAEFYAHTGTPADPGVAVQVFAVAGR